MLKRTPFFEQHTKLGGRLVDFGGWELPIQYSGLIDEHKTVREKVGIFDVSHMGEIWVHGPQATEALQYLMTNTIRLSTGQAQYTCMCDHNGCIIDDLIVYRLETDRYLLCVNASNTDIDFNWIRQQIGSQSTLENAPYKSVVVTNASDHYGQIALQGRSAVEILNRGMLPGTSLSELSYYGVVKVEIFGVANVIIARTGYTGEDGFEIFIPVSHTNHIWDTIMELGQEYGIKAIGLGARDTLRLEARMNLYGNDMTRQYRPHESGLLWTVDLDKSDFIGKAAIAAHKSDVAQWTHRLIGFVMDDGEKRIARPGYHIFADEEMIGEVTSGTRSPILQKGIGFARIKRKNGRAGTKIQVSVRGKAAHATVVKGPFYRRDY